MSDLVTRLRKHLCISNHCMGLKQEAADIIEQQQAEIERLRKDRTLFRNAMNKSLERIDKLQAVVDAATALRDRIKPRSKGGIAYEYYALRQALAALEEADDGR